VTASVTVSHMMQNSALGEGTSIYVKTAKCIGGLLLGALCMGYPQR